MFPLTPSDDSPGDDGVELQLPAREYDALSTSPPYAEQVQRVPRRRGYFKLLITFLAVFLVGTLVYSFYVSSTKNAQRPGVFQPSTVDPDAAAKGEALTSDIKQAIGDALSPTHSLVVSPIATECMSEGTTDNSYIVRIWDITPTEATTIVNERLIPALTDYTSKGDWTEHKDRENAPYLKIWSDTPLNYIVLEKAPTGKYSIELKVPC